MAASATLLPWTFAMTAAFNPAISSTLFAARYSADALRLRVYPLISGKGRAHHGEIMQEATKLAEAGKLIPFLNPHHYTPTTIENAYNDIEHGKMKGKTVNDIIF